MGHALSTVMNSIFPGVGSLVDAGTKALTPKIPSVSQKAAAPPPVPTFEDPAVADAAQEERRRAARAGRASTILTSALGDLSAPSLSRKTLLGS